MIHKRSQHSPNDFMASWLFSVTANRKITEAPLDEWHVVTPCLPTICCDEVIFTWPGIILAWAEWCWPVREVVIFSLSKSVKGTSSLWSCVHLLSVSVCGKSICCLDRWASIGIGFKYVFEYRNFVYLYLVYKVFANTIKYRYKNYQLTFWKGCARGRQELVRMQPLTCEAEE